ncbi:RNA-processing protein [Candidatus Woesearchaeota archaeon]|jgi:ribosomal RNA assembly protein|nr:RNA-processing protein [Candidatus Woesearchaeota archaeon]MBT5272709.1 RNA-processing protein [Candidatus Woesearchaeota archaeon]MBT6040320.1 RNA-processing protein [Candidatus Woesearchaeota archaeon]MBT6337046.1 RNA-processing protein [Candidatus Woesearchaeota archaeon]MBT7927900.1 RNA-processing protein [Candidatus Woesearchaeota archaeon]
MPEYSYDIKIPKDRVAVLIGKNGEVKKALEELTHTKISVDSREGDVIVVGEDPLTLFSTRDIIRAIARGFNPDLAQLLLKSDYMFELVELKDFVKNKNQMPRIKGRIIGKDGKSREIIESLTDTYVCIYGKTIGIIGLGEDVAVARRAIESLVAGSPHSNVYKWLEKKRREKKLDFV